MKKYLPLIMRKLALFVALGMLAVLFFQACEMSPEKKMKKACGVWEIENRNITLELKEKQGIFWVNIERPVRGKMKQESYLVKEKDGFYYIETGFSKLLYYDRDKDELLVSPFGTFKRKSSKK